MITGLYIKNFRSIRDGSLNLGRFTIRYISETDGFNLVTVEDFFENHRTPPPSSPPNLQPKPPNLPTYTLCASYSSKMNLPSARVCI